MTHKLFCIFSILLFCLPASQAQDIKEKTIKATELNQLPPTLKILTKNETITFVTPIELQYWKSSNNPSLYLWDRIGGIEAKNVKLDKGPDYIFELSSEGLTYVGNTSIRNVGEKKLPVVDFEYTMPISLIAKDKNGTILKTFILDDGTKVHTTTYHPNLFDGIAVGYGFNTPVTTGFGGIKSNDDLYQKFEKNKKDILTRAEFNTIYKNLGYAEQIVQISFSKLKTDKPEVMSIEKKYLKDFAELNTSIENLTSKILSVFEGKSISELVPEFRKTGDFLVSQYNNESSKNFKKICAFNAATAYSFAGDFDKAFEQINIAKEQLGFFSSLPYSFDKNFEALSIYHQLSNQDGTIVMKPKISVAGLNAEIESGKVKEQHEKLLARNISGVDGKVVATDGKEHTGKITVEFVEMKSSNIADDTYGRLLTLAVDGGEKTFTSNNVSYFTIGERYFEPVKEKEGTGLKILKGALAASFGSTFFLEKVYSKNDLTVYYSPMYDYYLIKRNSEKEAYSFSSLLGKGKGAQEFASECAVLKERISEKSISANLEGAKEYVDILSTCNQ